MWPTLFHLLGRLVGPRYRRTRYARWRVNQERASRERWERWAEERRTRGR